MEADRFQSVRVADAVTFGHAPHLEVRARRAGFGMVIGALVAVLAVVAMGIYGLLVPGGATAWRQAGAIILDKDTGARMIYRDGALHAVRNHSSALLAQGADAAVVSTSAASLAGIPLGGRIGIVGAPDTVPPASGLAAGGWLLCASSVAGRGSARDSAVMTLLVDDQAAAASMRSDRFALVQDAAGREWVLAGGKRHAVQDPLVPLVLGMRTARPVVLPEVWLRSRPVGSPLARPRISGVGASGPLVDGSRAAVGTLFTYTAANGRKEGLVVLQDGLAAVPQMEFALLSAHASAVRALTASAVAAAPRSADAIPGRMPDLVQDDPVDLRSTAVCQQQRDDGSTSGPLRTVAVSGPAFLRRSTTALNFRLNEDQGVYAVATDAVGDDAVDEARRFAPRYLIIGDGQKYPLLTSAAAKALGFGQSQPRPVPPKLLALLPTGPALSRAAVGSRDR